MSDIKTTLQTLIDNAVKEGVIPGLQCTLFNKDGVIFNGVSGYASLPSESNPAGKPMTKETIFWGTSCMKLVTSLLVLHILDKGLIPGVSMADLDDPDVLARIVVEFAPGSGSLITKIIDGFEDGLGPDGKKIMKLRDAKNRITLRQLLTQSSGMGYPVGNPILLELMAPGDGSIPNLGGSMGPIADLFYPLLFEPGTGYCYGMSTNWLGQFIVRGTGKHLRQLVREILVDPLQIPASEMDLWLSPELEALRSDVHARDESLPYRFKTTVSPISLHTAENGPGEGMAYVADAGLFASMQAYAKLLQAILTKDSRIMSASTWDVALKDDFGPRGLKVTRPDFVSSYPVLFFDIDEYSKTNSENGAGINMLSCKVALVPTLSGRSAGSFGWGGMSNIYYFVDPNTGLGGVIGAQFFPFFDPKMVELRDQFESTVCRMLAN